MIYKDITGRLGNQMFQYATLRSYMIKNNEDGMILNFKKAYAISIHKSQGSEFDIVIIPLVKEFNKMLYRKLIYTAVTRCKKRLFLVGEKEAFKFAISNKDSNLRRTTIKKFITEGINSLEQ